MYIYKFIIHIYSVYIYTGGSDSKESACSILAWGIPWRGVWRATAHRVARSQT